MDLQKLLLAIVREFTGILKNSKRSNLGKSREKFNFLTFVVSGHRDFNKINCNCK